MRWQEKFASAFILLAPNQTLGTRAGTPGLAGVMKVLLALKHSNIPPNMLLEELSPTVRPFYTRLQIPQKPLDWHKPTGGEPRRASVNSFGFGGTNAHVIVEEVFKAWEPPSAHELTPTTSRPGSSNGKSPFLPFLFSAPDLPNFSECFITLQNALNTLPPSTAPTWTLVEELMKTSESSTSNGDTTPRGIASRLATADP